MSRIYLLSLLILLIFAECKSISKTESLPIKADSVVENQLTDNSKKPETLAKEALMKDNDEPINNGGECIIYKDVKKVDCPNRGEKVCGCDGKTYANKCEALRHVTRYSKGSCE